MIMYEKEMFFLLALPAYALLLCCVVKCVRVHENVWEPAKIRELK